MSRGSGSRGPRLLVTHRNACVLLERARVHVSGERVVYHAAEPGMIKRFNIPHCNVAVLFLGQGTSITQEAAQRLSDEGVMVAFSGSGGTPILMGSLVTYQATPHFRRMLRIYDSREASLAAAKEISRRRVRRMTDVANRLQKAAKASIESACGKFAELTESAGDHASLMSAEGDFAKSCYAAFSAEVGAAGFVRKPGADDSKTHHGAINRMIDHGNYLAYGITGAALWAMGVPVHMSIMHGKTRAGGLAFDLADSWKDSVIIPSAMRHSIAGDENAFRNEVVDIIHDEGLLSFSVDVVEAMIMAGESVIGPLPQDLRFEGFGRS